ncbi:MAG: hypothetical protein Q9220_002998 [cf. Caloplaca sp. 1 TL-2023]
MANVSQDAAGLSSLFASLRPTGSRNVSSSQPAQSVEHSSAQNFDNIRQPHPFRPPPAANSPQQRAAASITFSPSPSNLDAHSFSQRASMSNPPLAAGDSASTERTANLLNLLKFGTASSSNQNTSQQQQSHRAGYAPADTHSVHGRGISASDLVGSFMGKSASPISRENSKPPAPASHQEALLKLLNRSTSASLENPRQSPKPFQTQEEEAALRKISQGLGKTSLKKEVSQPSDSESKTARKESPIRYFGTSEAQPTPFEPQDIPKLKSTPQKEPLFTYVNPFEQLAASSPRPTKVASPTGEGHKRRMMRSTPEPATSRRKFEPSDDTVLQSIESPAPTPLEDGRTKVEALMGIGAPTKNAETVAEALNEVGNKVDQEAERALAKAEARADEMERVADAKKEDLANAQKATLHAIEERVHDAASEVKKELDKEENKGILEEAMPAPVAEALKDIIDEAAQDNAAEAWESDDGDAPQAQKAADAAQSVRVYQFPLRPFVSIDIKQKNLPTLDVRDEAIIQIARLRKEFDQTDRILATATTEFIVYSSPKPGGGLKIIRQDDGMAKQLFAETRDRIFNVSLSTTPPPEQGVQTVLATGISGAVYWATLLKPDTNVFEQDLAKEGLIFPPAPSHTDNVSGGTLKTRTKRSSRHPGVFAIGRGKAIHIIFPYHARNSEHLLGGDHIGTGTTLDTEKYLQERNVKIVTGKAGKDFTFSEDDSVILTLDKAGRLKFWDVVDLLDSANGTASKIAPIELKTPVLTFATASATEKSWPTSVLFIDKLRPYTKGIAQRYALVGMKQNHTLQLWDLCLLKSVQELNFPHEKETDAICSIAYHPASGIIVVAHPTRNSIYFIHLSAPKYNLPSMSQAKFVQRLANKDPTLPRPEATAIMSGLREYSFESVGEIRSLDLVSSTEPRNLDDDDQDPNLFELYVMHSRGVTNLGVNKADLGWSKESKVLHPVDAESEKYILVKDLRETSQVTVSEQSSLNGDHVGSHAASAMSKATPQPPSKTDHTTPKKSRKSKVDEQTTAEPPSKPERADEDGNSVSAANREKMEKKKKKKRDAAAPVTANASANTAEASSRVAEGEADAAQLKETNRDSAIPDRSVRPMANGESINLGISGDFLDKELKKIEHGVSVEFKRVFAQELETLYRRFDDDKRVQSAAGSAKQEAVLRLVSSTLGDNVEKTLSRIIQTSIQQTVLPSIVDMAGTTLDRKLSETLTQQLHHAIPSILKLALPEAVSRGVQSPEVLRLLSEQLTSKLSSHVDREFSTALHQTIMPAFQNLALSVGQKVSNESGARMHEILQHAENQRRNDNEKIDRLTDLVRGLSETVHAMAAAQTEFQQEILKLQQQVIQERRASSGSATTAHHASGASRDSVPQKSPEQEALDSVEDLINDGRLEEGTIQWLQSEYQNFVFDGFLTRLDPSYLRHLSSLLNLSVGAAVTSNLETNLAERLTWLEIVFSTLKANDQELRDIGPRIMELLRERLEAGFMHVSMVNPGEPALRRIPPLAHQAREFLRRLR